MPMDKDFTKSGNIFYKKACLLKINLMQSYCNRYKKLQKSDILSRGYFSFRSPSINQTLQVKRAEEVVTSCEKHEEDFATTLAVIRSMQ